MRARNQLRRPGRRRGAMILEFALVLPILLLLTLGTVAAGLGVSQFQQVAALAREGSRWASVRGAEYQKTTGKAAATASDVLNKAVLPLAVGMAPGALACQVTWSPDNQPGSTVTVKVTYQWTPSAYTPNLGSLDILSSTSVTTVSY